MGGNVVGGLGGEEREERGCGFGGDCFCYCCCWGGEEIGLGEEGLLGGEDFGRLIRIWNGYMGAWEAFWTSQHGKTMGEDLWYYISGRC